MNKLCNYFFMNKQQFDRLNFNERGKHVLLKVGRFIASRTYYNQKLVLYDMGKFFAEVWYEPNENKITDIVSLSPSDKKIDLYIK